MFNLREFFFNLFNTFKTDIAMQLNDINLAFEKANGIEKYRTLPKHGHEFEITDKNDGVYSVRCSYYGVFYQTILSDNLIEDLSTQLRLKPQVSHRYNTPSLMRRINTRFNSRM